MRNVVTCSAYAAPEAIVGEVCTLKSDIYRLGACSYVRCTWDLRHMPRDKSCGSQSS